ncbi:transcriptional regulator [Paraburkholderia sp. GAS348]|uniref:transcriptional regulator n=1 Tax=Paraburkholderia sp. GAS348 TaxID=3035132 RepID=UPI003D19F320
MSVRAAVQPVSKSNDTWHARGHFKPHGSSHQLSGSLLGGCLSHPRRMRELDDKQAFSKRLKQALRRSPKPAATASELAVQFNLRYLGEPITPQAAQKWLTGKARPTANKIRTLAEWLDVPETWLRFGVKVPSEGRAKHRPRESDNSVLTTQEVDLIRCFRQLPEHRQRLIRELVEDLALDG